MLDVASDELPHADVGRRIEESYLAKGWTRSDFQKEVGYSWTTVCNWVKGKYLPRREAMERIAEVLDRSPEYFETGDEDAPRLNEWPRVYREWLKSPEGKVATEVERAWVKTYRSNFEPTPAILSQHLSRARALYPEQFRDE